MLIQVLKSKLAKVIVTGANKECEGSLTLDPDLIDAMDLYPNECVHVNDVNGESRIITYIIPGIRGSGQVELNGGAANFFNVGDHIHVNCFAFAECNNEFIGDSIVVKTDENNKVID